MDGVDGSLGHPMVATANCKVTASSWGPHDIEIYSTIACCIPMKNALRTSSNVKMIVV